jgi:Cu(I)/Ag(I) efflux system protein CusF
MKPTITLALILVLSAPALATAQSGGMKDMDMKGMDMKGMDMKGMDMKGMDNKPQAQDSKAMTHQMNAVVKDVDIANGKVTLAHEPVKSLDWPAMTMGFSVKDKMLFEKLVTGKKVKVEFMQQGSDYVVTAVK